MEKVPLSELLDFSYSLRGIALKDWVSNPRNPASRRIVFPALAARIKTPGVKSAFIKVCIDRFYPCCSEEFTRQHSILITTDAGIVYILESDLDPRKGEYLSTAKKLIYPSYTKLKTELKEVTFLGCKVLTSDLETTFKE